MSLRPKVLLFVAFALIFMAAAIYLPSQHFVLHSFSQIEFSDSVKDMERLRDAVLNDLATLGEVAADYAAWDATVEYAAGANPRYVEENLAGETFRNLRVHFAAIIDKEGTFLWSRFWSEDYGRELVLPESLMSALKSGGELNAHTDNASVASGMLTLSEGPILLVSHPIVQSDLSGERHGVFVLGRWFSEFEASRLADLTHIPFKMNGDPSIPPETAILSKNAAIVVRPVDRKTMETRCFLRDLKGEYILSLDTARPRAIYARGYLLLTYIFLLLGGTIIVFGVVISVVMERQLIKPITAMSANATLSFSVTGGESNERGGNELATLAAIVDNAKVFRKLLMNSSDIICVLDRNGRIKYVSRSVERVLGWPREALLTHLLFDILHPDDVEQTATHFQALLRGDSVGELQFSCRKSSGDYSLLAVSPTNMLTDPDVAGVMLNARDITDKAWAEHAMLEAKEAAERANRLKSEFLANVSHEIRTPLNGVIGFAEIILGSRNAEDMREHARIILRESESLLQLINTLLDHAKIEAGKLEIDLQPFSLDALLDSVGAYGKTQSSRKGLIFDLNASSRAPSRLVGDALRLRQVLMNLLSNAVKFTEKGRIMLSVDSESLGDNRVLLRFEVSDTGIGIPEEKQSAIFESFSQADSGTARRYGGTGLGTTIARRLVELMDGVMGLNSVMGQGTTFWFTIPLALYDGPIEDQDWLATPVLMDTARTHPGRGLRVLVADDYEPNCDLVRMHLEEAGYSVVTCSNGEDAVKACTEQFFDLVLMDVQMPVMDGFEATRRLRMNDATTEIPIVALTAHVGEEMRDECLAVGMSASLPKPIRKAALLSVAGQWVRRSGVEDDMPSDAPASAAPVEPHKGVYFRPVDKDTPPLNFAEALREFNGKRELVDRVATRFISDADAYLAILREALAKRDRESLLQYGHKIHGSAATLAAHPFASAGAELESAARIGDDTLLDSLVAKVEAEYARLAEYWEQLSDQRSIDS